MSTQGKPLEDPSKTTNIGVKCIDWVLGRKGANYREWLTVYIEHTLMEIRGDHR